jgi:hypothetical protein
MRWLRRRRAARTAADLARLLVALDALAAAGGRPTRRGLRATLGGVR